MVIFLCILTAGMGRMFLADRYYEQQSSWAAGSEGCWTGIVKEAPSVNRDGDAYARYYTELKSITYSDGVEKSLSGTAFVYDTRPEKLYGTGDSISVTGKMTAVRIYKNPGKIDLEGRYRSRRLMGRIYPQEPEKSIFWEKAVSTGPAGWPTKSKERWSPGLSPTWILSGSISL